MKIAVLGSGAREHALSWKLSQSPDCERVFVLPGNGGTQNNIAIDPLDFVAIEQFCVQQGVSLIVVGAETPLAQGICAYFEHSTHSNIRVFGASKAAAQMESSKIWAKHFMSKYGIRTAPFWHFNDTQAPEVLPLMQQLNGNLVIKYDGLAAGKGVFVCADLDEACSDLARLEREYGRHTPFLIEHCLQGYEVSLIGFTDGKSLKMLPPAQDHKQLLDNDKGPNTGGMGVFCPFPLTKEQYNDIQLNIINPTMRGIAAEGFAYKGILYFGIMLCPNGAYLLEYNTRLGDPEAEVLLPALESDLLAIICSCLDGNLEQFDIKLSENYFVDVVLASGGYPGAYSKDISIHGLEQMPPDSLIFHAGTRRTPEGNLLTAGGRVLNVVGQGNSLQDAIDKAYGYCSLINFEKMHYRRDIGSRKNAFHLPNE